MWEFAIIVLCLLMNAVIAATEFAFVTIRKPQLRRLQQEGHRAAGEILRLRENPEKTLSVLQLGITFIGVVAAAVGGAGVDTWFAPWLKEAFNFGPRMTQVFAILLFVVPYTFITVVLGELVPKTLALRSPKWVIFNTNRALIIFGKLLTPIVFLLETSTRAIAKIFHRWLNPEEKDFEEGISVGNLIRPYMMNLAQIEGRKVGDAMIPWREADKIEVDEPLETVKERILQTGHTRIPVVDRTKPIGLLLTKQFMKYIDAGNQDWQAIVRPCIAVDEGEKLIHALRKLQKERSHLGIVERDGRVTGIVTIEDILEQIVGQIYDEDDPLKKELDTSEGKSG